MRILVVEDDATLADAVVEVLRDEHYAVDHVADAEGADLQAHVNEYDLVVLDWSLPDGTGLALVSRWREEGRDVPVLMLTGRTEVADRVTGLDAGADDYLTKPFSFDELLARVRSLLRRRARPVRALEVADLVIDRPGRRVEVAGREVETTPKEFALLEYFALRPDEVISRTELAEHAWDERFDAMSNVVDVQIYRLRKKIDPEGRGSLLHTVKGVGYVLRSTREERSS